MRRATESGFTLVEVLIALAITAFVASAAYAGLSAVISGAEQLQVNGERLRDVNRAFTFISRDIRQFSERPVRDEFGELQPAINGGPLALYPLSVTRAGWHNSLQQPRSDLQRVYYFLDEDRLSRGYYPVLDRSTNIERLDSVILEGVDNIEVRFLDAIDNLELDRDLVVDSRNWVQNWISEPGSTAVPPAPAALEIRLTLADLGELRRIYEFPAR